MRSFRNKVVVITGAGSGMGRAYAKAFAREGALLALNDFNPASLEETVALLRQQGCTQVYSQAFDVADEAAFAQFAAAVETALGKAHVIINNAGIEGAVQPVWLIPTSAYQRIMDINFYGVVHGTRAFLPQLIANGEGAVVNVSSIFGLVGTPNSADYCASKFAVRGFTEALMAELQDSPIRAYLVHPGGIDTNIAQKAQSSDFSERYLTTPPEAMAEHLLRCLRRGCVRVVYGKGAFKTWLGSRLLPLRWLSWLIWKELKPVTDTSAYPWVTKAPR